VSDVTVSGMVGYFVEFAGSLLTSTI